MMPATLIARPGADNAYSCTTMLSSTPQMLSIRAQMTPVRSFPSEQWMSTGAGPGGEHVTRWAKMLFKGCNVLSAEAAEVSISR